MKITDFLDNGEQRQVLIIQYLMTEFGGIKITELASRLGSNRNTTKEDLDKLTNNLIALNNPIELIIDGNVVNLIVHERISFTKIVYFFLKDSLKYKLLLHMLTSKQVGYQTLAEMLNISLSTLTRKIRDLNQTLDKYHLKIHKGRIIGPEIAIRYFYFQLFWFGNPYQVNMEKFLNPSVMDLLTFLEKNLDYPFTAEGRVKLCIWLYITKCRFRNTKVNHELPLSEALHLAFNQSAFVGLQEVFIRFFSRYAFQWNQSESQYLYLFMIANYTLEIENEHVQMLSEIAQNNQTIASVNETFFSELYRHFSPELLTEKVKKIMTFSVLQIHYKILYFPSFFSIWGNINRQSQLISRPNPELNRLAEQLMQITFKHVRLEINREKTYNEESVKKEIFNRYLVILYIIYRQLDIHLNVGCDFPFEDSMNALLIEEIEDQINPKIKARFTEFNKQNSYDVVITYKDENPELPNSTPVYTLLSIEHNIDFPVLEEFLDKYYQNKIHSKVNLL
ncbi:helix-turn-helix domain-containing protein [Enterococcus dongliensis]|uniref:helix-turn-helix domain-containing protein n=1 Tax=Enterococcus dongliensis TaxID=2559925 RepID=UPI00288D6675|nr:helix-turn-helix domain-containing protein [Enterococcus dongliensis]MDT2638763.1 helix-turn-helix domain-containing protein [Enterococcus dongliensis]